MKQELTLFLMANGITVVAMSTEVQVFDNQIITASPSILFNEPIEVLEFMRDNNYRMLYLRDVHTDGDGNMLVNGKFV